MNYSNDRRQSTSQDSVPSSAPATMAAAAPLPTIRPDAPHGASDVQRLPSLTELFPDRWQPPDSSANATTRDYFPGARGPQNFPGPPSIAPSPLVPSRARDNSYTSSQAPASLSPSSQQHSPALPGRSTQLLPPMQPGDHQRSMSSIYGNSHNHSQSSTPPQAPRDIDMRAYPPGSPHSGPHPSFYGGMPPRDYPSQMAPPPPPPPGVHPGQGYPTAPPFPAMNFSDGMSDYGDGKKPGRRRGNLPKPVTDILRMWFQDHVAHPYPTEEEKQQLMHQTGLTISQISNWFINARRRSLPRMAGQGPPDGDL